jgi:hypothetical protein
VEKDGDIERLRGELDAARVRVAAREGEVAALRKELTVSRALLAEKDAAVEALHASFSWRITTPIRMVRKLAATLFRPRASSRTIGAPVDAGEMVVAAPKVCIFGHYDRDSKVSDYVFELLRGPSPIAPVWSRSAPDSMSGKTAAGTSAPGSSGLRGSRTWRPSTGCS